MESRKSKLKVTLSNLPDKGSSVRYKAKDSRLWSDAVFYGAETVQLGGKPVILARLGAIETGSNFFIELSRIRKNPNHRGCEK